MKRFALAIALACILSGSALAGDVHTTGGPEPGDIHSGGEPTPREVHSTGDPAPGEIPMVEALLAALSLAF